jgi:transposase
VLAEFDEAVEMLCQEYYKDGVGRPPPGRYFRMLFVGQFEGLESEREIAWRCADSLSLHRFLRLSDGETVPSTLSVTRLPLEHAVFGFLLEIANKHDLVRAKRIGASTQDAALRRLVRRDTGEDYQEMLRPRERHRDTKCPDPLRPKPQGQVERRLGVASCGRPDEGWHLASKPEHALDTGVIVAIHPAEQGDTQTGRWNKPCSI